MELDRKTLTIKAVVAPRQELDIIEPVTFTVNYPWRGADQGRPLEFTSVGLIRLRSNAPWALYAQVVTDTPFQVSIRPTGERNWQSVSGGPILYGKMGSYNLSFDVRVEAPSGMQPCNGIVEIGFTVSEQV